MARQKVSTILLADDDVVQRDLLRYQFERAGLYFNLFDDGEDLLAAMHEDVLVCVVDLMMPIVDGMTCLKQIKKQFPDTEVIILTNHNEAKEAIQALKHGAFDYLTKPFDPEEVILAVRKAMQLSKASRDVVEIKQAVSGPTQSEAFLGKSSAMKRVHRLVSRMAPADNPILLTGESGTGKGVIARAIHAASPRAKGPFIAVSCPSLPKDLLESEMFGHEKGAFSGATSRRLGRAELAHGGTLFLDEIGEMPLELQPKLLTFLQEKVFYRVGGEQQLASDVRLIAATNVDLPEQVRKGAFREDLYFRLNVLPIPLPALRERDSDILSLAEFFLQRMAQKEGIPAMRFTPKAQQAIQTYRWPGNVRELENAIARAYVLREHDDRLDVADLPTEIISREQTTSASVSAGSAQIGGQRLEDLEKTAIIQTLELCQGNKAESARVLGITEKTIYNKMKRFGIR